MYKLLLLTIIVLTCIIICKLVIDGEWYLAASLLWGIFIAKEELKELFYSGVENED